MNINMRHYTIITILAIIPLNCNADIIKMAFSMETPPYVFNRQNGIEFDIIKEALAYKNHSLKAIFLPLGRIAFSFKNSKEINAAQRDNGTDLSRLGYYSSTVVTYYSCILTLERSNIKITNPKDLTKYKIIGFQGAKDDKSFKQWLRLVSPNNYKEIINQREQAYALQTSNTDIAIADLNVINYYHNDLLNSGDIESIKPINCKHVGNKNSGYKAIFKNKQIRDDFNTGLKYIIDNGFIDKIYKKYNTKLAPL